MIYEYQSSDCALAFQADGREGSMQRFPADSDHSSVFVYQADDLAYLDRLEFPKEASGSCSETMNNTMLGVLDQPERLECGLTMNVPLLHPFFMKALPEAEAETESEQHFVLNDNALMSVQEASSAASNWMHM